MIPPHTCGRASVGEYRPGDCRLCWHQINKTEAGLLILAGRTVEYDNEPRIGKPLKVKQEAKAKVESVSSLSHLRPHCKYLGRMKRSEDGKPILQDT